MKKFIKSFVYSFQGLSYAFKTQLSFKIEVCAAIAVIILGCFIGLTNLEWMWIGLAITLVLVLELLNTALEVFVDLVSPEQQPKAGAIKDLASAAVLVSALFSLLIAAFIFMPKFL